MKTFDRIPDLLTLLSLPPDTVLRGVWRASDADIRIGPFHAGCITDEPLDRRPGIKVAMQNDKLWIAGKIKRGFTCVSCGRRVYAGKPT